MEYVTARIPLLADELKRKIDSVPTRTISLELVQQWLHDYALTVRKQPVGLPFIRPDFEGIKQALQADLYTKNSWREIIQAGVGETLLEWVATIGAADQLSIQRSFQEAFLPTARMTSSIYEAARHLGVHIVRKRPASLGVSLTSTADSTVQIPSLSQFRVEGIPFFNRDTVVVPVGGTTNVMLYQGEVKIVRTTGQNRPFQIHEIGDEDFSVSDTDVYVYNQKFEEYKRVIDGLWHYQGQDKLVFYENSTANGNVELWFGNSIFGRQPKLDEQLFIVYIKTLGNEVDSTLNFQRVIVDSLNDVVPDRLTVLRGDDVSRQRAVELEKQRVVNTVSGFTTTPISQGTGPLEPEFYRRMAPHIYSARSRAVSRKDHYAMALQYPGIADVYFRGQEELGKLDRNYINSVAVTPIMLDGKTMNNDEFARFETYMRDIGISELNYWHAPPTKIVSKVSAKVFVESDADIPRTEAYLRYRLLERFRLRQGSLGNHMYKSDIDDILKANHYGVKVDYVQLQNPSVDTVISRMHWISLPPENIDLVLAYSSRSYTGGYLYKPTST